MPKLAIGAILVALVALSSTMTYAGYLVLGVISSYLGISRIVAGLLLGILFARLPRIQEGKLRTVGLLPKKARLPVMLALLAACFLSFLYRGEMVPMLFVGLAATLLVSLRWMRQLFVKRVLGSLFRSPSEPVHSRSTDKTIIDVEFQEKKD